MPKKRYQQNWSYKPRLPVTPASSERKSTRSVNDILANLRRAPGSPSSSSINPSLAGNSPSVPPAIREILQIPEAPPIAPRRPGRVRFDQAGRRLPPGPPPPRSWVSGRNEHGRNGTSSRLMDPSSPLARASSATTTIITADALPGVDLHSKGSLIDLVLRNIALEWEFQRIYNVYHLYHLPTHLKLALIRYISVFSGVSLGDLKIILLPPPPPPPSPPTADPLTEGEDEGLRVGEPDGLGDVTYLDVSGSLGRTLTLKELTDLVFPPRPPVTVYEEPQESWYEAATEASGGDGTTAAVTTPSAAAGPPRTLLPNLSHVSLALDPRDGSGASWKQLLTFSSRASSAITHLSLAYWPAPCLVSRASQQSRMVGSASIGPANLAYAGTDMYSHSLDGDWSEALLVLRMLSRNLYELEYLDLTGCAAWFPALMERSDHDFVDWAASWSKISHLKLRVGWEPAEDAMPSESAAYADALENAARVEKHIRARRAGQGRFITVDRDRI
ncbi:hypothetical protein GMORB2_0408 [Geosmithia morbida]|uniref:Tafazzin n=1 Tax=Geosmithia morbida TaxID=1094350 RepID=A0A9P4Z1Z1_9HYPO|nr:uncharacterized protein GMORB2_0408 [Geosmithia morbida]KAF4126672.1 hypothetical protein GMORB2_0408 [Geosmithia morbida]